MGFVNYARRHPGDPTSAELLAASEHELGRMRDLIRRMLTFARPSDEKPSAVDIPQLINRAVQLLDADLKARSITMQVDLEDGLSRVSATPQLEQAILNLLLNARDAAAQVSEKRITIRSWSEGEEIFIEVSDSGPGVPENIRNRIFDPFFTTKTPGEGTGLGLSVSRTVIQEMGGELTLESHEGEETRFLVRLPKRHSPEGDPR
jgi:signal transduction histidine kinase